MRIGLVACCKEKLFQLASAEDLYQSQLFRLSRQYVERHCDSWYILSAKYGLLQPKVEISPYDFTLMDAGMEYRRSWANRCNLRLQDIRTPETVFVALAGERYRLALEYMVRLPYEAPMRGLYIGQQIAWLKRELAIPGGEG